MNNSDNSLSRPMSVPKWAFWTALFASLAGFIDSLYLTVNHYQQAIPPCSIGSCETVLTSRFATIAGMPISLAGVVGYLLIGILLLALLTSPRASLARWIAILVGLSFIVSIILVAIQAFSLNAFCLYCLISAGIDAVLFVCSIPFWKYK